MSASEPDVSVVVCTHDRPAQLVRLIDGILAQETELVFEIVIVDNDPHSGAVASVKERYRSLRWIPEFRKGLSYARNAGVRAARADVIALADDDLVVGPGWLQSLVGPILRGGYDAVTGPLRPLKVETDAERVFEVYGGHGHTGHRQVFDRAWLDGQRWLLPLWRAGALGNAAIRRDVFERLGWLEEALGVGTAAGSSEDLEYMYRMLRAGCRILHAPEASALHQHRPDLPALQRQLAGYRRGEVCFCLIVAKRYRDPRALSHLFVWIPMWHGTVLAQEVARRLRGDGLIPFSLMGAQLLALLGGPRALIASVRRKQMLGRGPPAANADQELPLHPAPDFSVVVPTRDRGWALARCLEALSELELDGPSFEVIVVDDGSREPLDAMIAPWRTRLPLRLLRQDHAGPAQARNRGAEAARGTWLAFLDDDCLPSPGWLAGFAASKPAGDELVGGVTFNGLPENHWSAASQDLVNFVCDWLLDSRSALRFLPSNNLVICSEGFHALGGFSPEFPWAAAEDREFCHRWLQAGGRLRIVEKARVGHQHALGPYAFVRQHFRYGRGAFLFYTRGAPSTRVRMLPLAFYRDLILRPWRTRHGGDALLQALLLAASQVAGVTGFCFQSLCHALGSILSRLRGVPRPRSSGRVS